MDVYDPSKLGPFSVSVRSSVRKVEKQRTPICAYMVDKEAAITSKIPSASEGSLNSGVSIRVTALSSRVNTSKGWILTVPGFKPAVSGRLEPLARLINWRQPNEFLVIFVKHALLTAVFPLPAAPMTL